jgi:hypothetical protein
MAIAPPLPNVIIPWITTPLESGPLPVNHYSYAIDSLSASTQYEYRAYMVVDGLPYYGNTCVITTLGAPIQVPTVITGNAGAVTLSSMRITGNTIMSQGLPTPICEYGVLYTQIPSFSSDILLRCGCTGISKECIVAAIGIGSCYFNNSLNDLSPLSQNTVTYYRAYVKNATGIGYGEINTEQTCVLSNTTIYLVNGDYIACSPTLVCACAKLYVDPPQSSWSVGDGFRLNFSDTACSITDTVTLSMWACSNLKINSSTCNCVYSCQPDNIGSASLYCVDQCGKYIDINKNTNLANYTFYVVGQSHASNAALSYVNGASVCLTSIINQVGRTFVLGDEPNRCMDVYNANADNGGVSGGFLPSAPV